MICVALTMLPPRLRFPPSMLPIALNVFALITLAPEMLPLEPEVLIFPPVMLPVTDNAFVDALNTNPLVVTLAS